MAQCLQNERCDVPSSGSVGTLDPPKSLPKATCGMVTRQQQPKCRNHEQNQHFQVAWFAPGNSFARSRPHSRSKAVGGALDKLRDTGPLGAVIRRPLWGSRGASERADEVTSQHRGPAGGCRVCRCARCGSAGRRGSGTCGSPVWSGGASQSWRGRRSRGMAWSFSSHSDRPIASGYPSRRILRSPRTET